jgi:transcriptional regulator with XRE-family HTH domain
MGKLKREVFDSLLAFREAKRLSQAEAAALVGITQGMWSRLETGRDGARPAVARRISDITGVPLERLLNFGTADDESGVFAGVRQKRPA